MKYFVCDLKNRRLFWIVSALLLAICSTQAYAQYGWGNIQTNVPALKDVYKNDFYIGCLLSYAHVGFKTDPTVSGQSSVVDTNGGYLIKYHMNSMSPGNWMKPSNIINISTNATAYQNAATQQAKDSIDVHPIVTFNGNIIAQLNWAKRQGFKFRGHTLVWYQQTPGTAFFRSGYSSTGTRLTKEQMTARLENYIEEVIRLVHTGWPGLLTAYDVVNEAIDDNTGYVRNTSANEWYTTFGDSTYIMKAFEFARKYTQQYGETQIKLYYNDYNTHLPAKADGIVRIVSPIFRAGLLDGIGMQEHDANDSPTAEQWIATYNKFDTICTEMAVTEFDVSTNSNTNYPSASILATQANQYGQLFKCFVERSKFSGRGKIISVSKDGLRDSLTMDVTQASSLWDTRCQCKPAFYAAANVGINYNKVDSLITYANGLNAGSYAPALWALLSSAQTSAISAKNQNYSSTVSADAALSAAVTNLQTAINNLSVTAPTQIPVLLSPSNNAGNLPTVVTVVCGKTPDAAQYHWQVSTGIDFSTLSNSLFVLNDTTADTSRTIGPLTPGTKYYWRVRGVNSVGATNFSAIDSFTVGSTPSVPVLLSPANNAQGVRADTVRLTWNKVLNTSGYECQLSLNSSFSPLVVAKDSTADTTFTVTNLANPVKFYWRVRAYNTIGASAFSAIDSFTTQEALSVENGNTIPNKFSLSQNYPNPFNPSTNIAFSIPARAVVSLKIYNVLGQEVATLADGELSPGNYTRQWNALNIQSGVYFYRIQAGSFTATKKLILLK